MNKDMEKDVTMNFDEDSVNPEYGAFKDFAYPCYSMNGVSDGLYPMTQSVNMFNIFQMAKDISIKVWACTGVSMLLMPDLWVGKVLGGVAVLLTMISFASFFIYNAEYKKEIEEIKRRINHDDQ